MSDVRNLFKSIPPWAWLVAGGGAFLLCVLLCAGLVAVGLLVFKDRPGLPAVAGSAPPKVTAKALAEDPKTYAGREVIVTGEVTTTGPKKALIGDGLPRKVIARGLDAKDYTEGQSVTVRGRVSFGNVQAPAGLAEPVYLEDCKLVK